MKQAGTIASFEKEMNSIIHPSFEISTPSTSANQDQIRKASKHSKNHWSSSRANQQEQINVQWYYLRHSEESFIMPGLSSTGAIRLISTIRIPSNNLHILRWRWNKSRLSFVILSLIEKKSVQFISILNQLTINRMDAINPLRISHSK